MSIQIRRRGAAQPTQQMTSGDFAGVPVLLQRIYRARSITSSGQLQHDVAALLPFQQLLHIEAAAGRLAEAILHQQRIVIVGDYDADGATSTALGCLALRAFGAQFVDYFVPDRVKHGYGLSALIVHEVQARHQPDLIITVDNGIASLAGVAAARAAGIEVLVTDHHLAGDELPADCIIVNPNQPGDEFPSKNMAGVGVIFYVMLALRAYLKQQNYFNANRPAPNMAQYLDLVALGTVADVVPLDFNNRILVQQGLIRMRAGKCRPGIAALVKLGQRELSRLISEDLGFCVGPRLNAAGRLADMSTGIACLLAADAASALPLATQLDQLNRQRREVEVDIQRQAQQQVDAYLQSSQHLPVGLVVSAPHWHEGVIGLIASRIKDKLNRPTIAFTQAQDGSLKGSGRSISGVHLRDVLAAVDSQHSGLIHKFGGHAMAAGLSITAGRIAEFKQAFEQQIAKVLPKDALAAWVYTDGALGPEEMTLPVAQLLRDAAPWGQAFPAPTFDGEFILQEQRLLAEKHLKMVLIDESSGICFNAIAFQVDLAVWPNQRCQRVQVVYRLDVNHFRGKCALQLIVSHLAAAAVTCSTEA